MSQDDESAFLKTRGMVDQLLPPIPSKRYFTIGEVSDLCAVKPHVLRYWEQEFTQLRPMKRRGNRRYYQHHEVLLIRKIRELLYDEGFTIQGARMRLSGRQTLSNLQAEAAALVRLQLAEQESAQGALLQLSSTPTPAMDPESDVGVPRATVMSQQPDVLKEPQTDVLQAQKGDALQAQRGDALQAKKGDALRTTKAVAQTNETDSEGLSASMIEQLRSELSAALRLLSIA